MDTERWRRVQDLFHQVADLPPDARTAELDAACGDDAALRRDVEALLAADAGRTTLLDHGVAALADAVITGERDAPVPQVQCGPYRLLRRLGEGGMGVVYLASRDDVGREAAVKLLRDAWLSPARRERFLSEQRTLAQLEHPAIARFLDAGVLADGTPWIAMEHVEGEALHDHCRRQALPLRQRLQLLHAVGEAVLHAHQHLVVHRDLKPGNVLVSADGTVKLLDFGIAKQLDAGDQATRTGLRLMTPAYAAPEQVTGGAVGVRSDVYSLGVMLYELLTGTLPFDLSDRTPGEAEALITRGEADRPSTRARAARSARHGSWAVTASDSAWADLDVLCLTAMHRDPARRYRSVDAFLRDLDRFLAGEPLDARGDSVGYRVATFARRHARALTAAAAVVTGVVVLSTFYTVRLAAARDRALAESVRAQRIQRFMSTLFQGGDEAAGPADSLRVITLLERGVAEARALDQEPRVQADLFLTLGEIHAQLGVLDRADSLLQRALAQWRQLAGAQGVEAARAAMALGDLRTSQARFDDAEPLLREAIVALAARGDASEELLADARTRLARSYTERGEHARAIAVLDSLVSRARERGAEPRAVHEAIGELANAHFYAGNYDVADSLNRQVLALTRTLLGAQHPRVAEDLMNLGATEQERGHYQESERYFREALDISTAFYGEEHYRTAGNLTYLGRALLLQGRTGEARDAFERALAVRERVFGATHPLVANTLNELGSLAVREDRYEEAERTYARVRRIYQAAYPGGNYRIGVATGNLADALNYQRQYSRAEPLYREALEIYRTQQGAEHLNTGIGHIKLGRVLLRLGRLREAIPETERGYAIVKRITAPDISFLQAARLDLSLALDSLGRREEAARWRAEREQYLPK